MEDHFNRVLSTEVASKRSADPSSLPGPTTKRARDFLANAAHIQAIVDGAEAHQSDTLDARTLKSMAHSLQKHIRCNALAREKHEDEPPKFLESELALHNELTRWKHVAAKPEVFVVMMELQVPRVLLGLLSHANLDIRLTVLGLVAEFTDVDDATTSLAPTRMLTTHLIDEQLVPLLVTNLYQLQTVTEGKKDGEMEEETMGLYQSLQILENLADLEPSVCHQIVETSIFPFLVRQVAPGRKFSENKLYASEILSILLQSGVKARGKLVQWMGETRPGEETEKKKKEPVNLLDELLQALAPYRKKDPNSDVEEEFASNLVNVLCSALLVPEAQQHFRHLEGLELLLRFVKDRKRFVFGGALRVMDHALMRNARNCERLIEIGGLPSVFSVFMGRYGRYKASYGSKASKKSEKAKEEENIVSVVASLCAWVRETASADGYVRLHAKFVENDMEKVDRLVDLFAKYHERVNSSTQADDEDEDEESRYLRRLDAGLFVLERICFVIAHLCRFTKKLRAYAMVKFHERNIDSDSLTIVLREQLDVLVADDAFKQEAEPDDSKETKEIVNKEAKKVQIAQLRELLETLQADKVASVMESCVETGDSSHVIDEIVENDDNAE